MENKKSKLIQATKSKTNNSISNGQEKLSEEIVKTVKKGYPKPITLEEHKKITEPYSKTLIKNINKLKRTKKISPKQRGN